MENAIQIMNLTKHYGKHRGVEQISLNVEKGDIYGFLGPNGAGKSTTIRCLLGMIRFQEGSAQILGMDVGKDQKQILANVGYMPSEVMFYPSMKVEEVIKLSADLRKKDCKEEARRLCDRLEVNLGRKISELSLGNRKKVGIVCAMQHQPDLLIFDEPTSGLDPLMQEAFFELVTESNKRGATCFLSSHVLPEVKKYCHHAGIIKEGRLICSDTVENLTKTGLRKVKIIGIHEMPLVSGIKVEAQTGDEAEFSYSGDMNELLEALRGQRIKDILISEPSLEEIFMHFYESKIVSSDV